MDCLPFTRERILFLVEGSASVGVSDFDAFKSFISDMAARLVPSSNRLVSVAEYSSVTTSASAFTSDLTEFQSSVDAMTRSSGAASNLGDALHSAVDLLFAAGRGRDLVLVVLAVNPASDPDRIPSAVSRLMIVDTRVIAIGLGTVLESELLLAATDSSTVFPNTPLSQLTPLQPVVASVLNGLCNVQCKLII